jgi:peptidoglycan/LPS O-acetylase OafA/YrhL
MKRNQTLDVLRGAAILLVLGDHSPYYVTWARAGWTGVPLFFVLSGFLISGLLFGEYKEFGSINIARFFLRRGFKIWPGYYALLGATVLLYHFAQLHLPVTNLMLAVFFLGNYFNSFHYGVVPILHIWSLAVEEHFYLVLPVLLIILVKLVRQRRNPFRVIPFVFAFSLLFCFFLRARFLPSGGWVTRTDMNFGSLFAGVTLGYLYHFDSDWFAKIASDRWLVWAAALFAPVLFIDQDTRGMETFGLTALVFAFSTLIAWSVSHKRWESGIIAKGLAKVGFYSYSIYLWHVFLTPSVLHYKLTFWSFWLYVIASIDFGIGMAILIELPFLRFRDRLIPREKPQRGTAIVQPIA